MTKSHTHKTKPKAKPAKKQQWANLQKTTKTSRKCARPQDSDDDDEESSDQELVANKGRATRKWPHIDHDIDVRGPPFGPTLHLATFP